MVGRMRSTRAGLVGSILALLATTACAGFDPIPDHFALSDDDAVELEVEWCHDLVFVEVMIGEAGPYRLLLDTGAYTTVLDDDLVAEAGLDLRRSRHKVRGSGNKTAPIAGFAKVEGMTIAGVEGRSWVVEDFEATAFDLEAFDAAFGRRFDGILGLSAFMGLTLELDYPERRVAVLPSRLEPDAALPEGVGRLEHSSPSRPVIEVDLAGRTTELLLDTGFNDRLSIGELDTWPLVERPTPVGASRGVGGLRTNSAARIEGQLAVGPALFVDPIASDDPKQAGKLGVLFMREYSWRFDPERALVEVAAGATEPVLTPPLVSLGFVADSVASPTPELERGLEVLALLADSPASADGLEVGDVVLRINGEPLPGVCERPSEGRESGMPLRLEVLRAGQVVEIESETYTLIE